MPYSIASDRNTWWPPSFALADNTLLLFANGLDAVMRWSGVPSAAERAGMPAPTSAIPLETYNPTSGGVFRGNYDFYYRFLGKDGQPGNLSPIVEGTYSSSFPDAFLYWKMADGSSLFPWVSDERIDKVQIWRTTSDQSITVYLDQEFYYPKHTAPTPPTTRPTVSTTATGPGSAGVYKAFVQINAVVRVAWSSDPVIIPWARSSVATSALASANDAIEYSGLTGGGSGGTFVIARTKAGGDVYYVDVTGPFTGNLSSVGTVSTGNPDAALTEIYPVNSAAPTVGYTGTNANISQGGRKFFYEALNSSNVVLARSPVTNSTASTQKTQIDYSGIAVGPTGTTKRRIYRTKVGGTTYPAPEYFLDVEIANNVATTGTSTTSDSSLGAALVYPDHPGPSPASSLSAPTITVGGSPGSSTDARYFFFTYVNEAGEESIPSPVRAFTPASAGEFFAYSNITAGGSGVVARRIYRTKGGEYAPFYLDVVIGNNTDTTATSASPDSDLTVEYNIRGSSATFVSDTPDSTLRLNTAMPILNADGSANANRFGEPPDEFSAIVGHQDRMFMAVPVEYTEGHCEVSNGSPTVQGRGTRFTSVMVGRYFYVKDHAEYYQITAVNTGSQTLTIQHRDTNVPGYMGPTDLFADYSVQPPPSYKNSFAWSGNSEPEAFDGTALIRLSDDGDQITGLMPLNAYLYILKRRHVYRAAFVRKPTDGGAPPVISRGCVNQRCWTRAHGVAYLMDYEGIYRFNGQQEEPVSLPIRNVFSDLINWNASKWFHAVDFPPEETVRFFVSLGSSYLPKHALCFNYRHEAWWIEEYPWSVGGSSLAESAVMRLLYGSEYGRILTPDAELDGIGEGTGRRGSFQSVTLLKGRLASGTPISDSFLNSPISIIEGKGVGQSNRIVTQETVGSNVDVTWKRPWKILPDTSSVYQIGAIPWTWKTGILHIAPSSPRNDFALSFEPSENQHCHLLTYLSHNKEPVKNKMASDLGQGVKSYLDAPEIQLELTKDGDESIGYRRMALVTEGFNQQLNTDRFVSFELKGYGRSRLYSVTVEGAM